MSSTPNSLIMGVAAHYPGELLLPFLKSLRQTDYKGKVCLFVGSMTDDAIAQIRPYADDIIVLDGEYGHEIARHRLQRVTELLKWTRRTPRVRRAYPALFRAVLRLACPPARKSLQRDLEQALEGFQSLRYQQYAAYLEQVAPNADYVLLSDVRDVIFQADPFDHVFQAELEVFLEAEPLRIGVEPFNRRWIQNLYDASMLDTLSVKTISCSGTTMGTHQGILRYLWAMNAEIHRHARPLGSHDQGVHNYLLYNGCLDPVHIYANGHGPVLTAGGETEIARDAQGGLLNKDGSIPPVVHQYDRHPDLAQDLCRRIDAASEGRTGEDRTSEAKVEAGGRV